MKDDDRKYTAITFANMAKFVLDPRNRGCLGLLVAVPSFLIILFLLLMLSRH